MSERIYYDEQMSFRCCIDDAQAIEDIAYHEGEKPATILRRAIRQFVRGNPVQAPTQVRRKRSKKPA